MAIYKVLIGDVKLKKVQKCNNLVNGITDE